LYSGYELKRLRLFSFCGYGLALAAFALVLFGAYDSYPLLPHNGYNHELGFSTASFLSSKLEINFCAKEVYILFPGDKLPKNVKRNGKRPTDL